MHPSQEALQSLTRRELFQRLGSGIGAIALTSLLNADLLAGSEVDDPLAPRRPHLAPRAKSVIHMHMIGAPSHLDLLEYKPTLQKHDGQLVPAELIEGKRFAFLRGHPKLLGTRVKF